MRPSNSGLPVLNVTDPYFGAHGNGAYDDTAAFNAALQAAFHANGGTVYFPCGRTYLIKSQIIIPSMGHGPSQPVIRLTGCGAGTDSGSILDLVYSGGPKIVTQGSGELEIDHIVLEDTADGKNAFLYSLATKVMFHDDTFLGRRGISRMPDAIVLGPPSMASGSFDGYGSVIRENTFSFVGAAVRMQAAVNGVDIEDNNIGGTCGGIAAFISAGDPSSPNHGAWIAGNLIEVTNYRYAFQASNTNGGFTLIGNNIYDTNNNVTHAYYRFESSAVDNLVIPGIQPVESGEVSLSEGSPGTNALIVPYRTNSREISQFLSGAALPALSLGGSRLLTGVQGSDGSRLAAASGNFAAGDAVVTDAHGDLVDSGVPSSKTLRNCGITRFSGSAVGPALPCVWVTPASACSVVARDRAALGQGAVGFTPSVGSVSLVAQDPGSGSFSVACSAN